MIKFAANNNLAGYVPPGYNKLRTTLLQKEKAHIEKLLRAIKDTWKEKGLSIVSDGWTDVQKRPLINFMATSQKVPIFIKSIDGTKEYKDKHFIADLFLKVVGEVGPQHVVQIITDNASVMKAAGSIVEAEYPHIFWSPCVVHTLNLALKNICAPKYSLQNEDAYNEYAPILHKVYEMWDSMIENVKKEIYQHEGKEDYEESPFYDVVHNILIERWTKNCTPLHCLAHSLNPKGRVAPHKDAEISVERNKCLKRIFPDPDDRQKVNVEFGLFNSLQAYDEDNMEDRWSYNPMLWWSTYGSTLPLLQTLALKLLEQPCSSSCAERNWSTYGFIHSMRRNKITPKCAEDLVFVHSNLRLLSRRRPEYNIGESKKWDIGGDNWDEPFGGPGLLEIAYLTLDEPEMETSIVENNDYVDDDDVVVL
uniref:Uncharacterized protein n=1 Tax=Quercus lobata TaxID=97700 RepID=A0A7N2LNF3_QUELO